MKSTVPSWRWNTSKRPLTVRPRARSRSAPSWPLRSHRGAPKQRPTRGFHPGRPCRRRWFHPLPASTSSFRPSAATGFVAQVPPGWRTAACTSHSRPVVSHSYHVTTLLSGLTDGRILVLVPPLVNATGALAPISCTSISVMVELPAAKRTHATVVPPMDGNARRTPSSAARTVAEASEAVASNARMFRDGFESYTRRNTARVTETSESESR